MSIKSGIFKTFIFLFASIISIGQCEADDEGAEISLKDMLYSNLTALVEKDYLEGELTLVEGKLKGELSGLKIAGDSLRPSLDSATISINKDNFECYLLLSAEHKPIELNIVFSVSNAFLSGFGVIESGANSAMIEMYSEKTGDKNYNLILNVDIEDLLLTGDFRVIISKLHLFKDILYKWSEMLGFYDLILNINGDNSINYLGLEFECTASLDFSSRKNEWTGSIISHEGKIWSYGKSFNVDYAGYQFDNNQIEAEGRFTKKAYYKQPGGGTVLQPVTITLHYSGAYPDSVRMKLTSKPEMSYDEIVNFLIKGYPVSNKINGTVAYTMEEKVKIAMDEYSPENLSKYTERQVGQILAFDKVVIEGESFSLDSPYYADKDITDRLRLQVRGTVGGTSSQTVSFDYRLIDHFSIVSETNQKGNTGIDLRYMIKFK